MCRWHYLDGTLHALPHEICCEIDNELEAKEQGVTIIKEVFFSVSIIIKI